MELTEKVMSFCSKKREQCSTGAQTCSYSKDWVVKINQPDNFTRW